MNMCVSCGNDLIPVEPSVPYRRRNDRPNFMDALTIQLEGNYGEYFDNGTVRFKICKTCADVLVKDNPWLNYQILFERG